jgi:hypothetical protein
MNMWGRNGRVTPMLAQLIFIWIKYRVPTVFYNNNNNSIILLINTWTLSLWLINNNVVPIYNMKLNVISHLTF